MATTINILTNHSAFTRGFHDLYPLLRWSKALRRDGYRFTVFNDHRDRQIFNADIVLLHHRYHEQIIKGHYAPGGFKATDTDFIVDFIETARRRGCKVIVFDGGDAGITWESAVLAAADLMLKKQVYKDKSRYLHNGNQPWLPEDLPLPRHKRDIPAVREADLAKIQVGWNIGLCDHRSFPRFIKKYYPLNTYTIATSWYDKIDYTSPGSDRPYLFSYRGGVMKGEERYMHNRKLMYAALEQADPASAGPYFLGGKVPFSQYMQEMRQSKVGLSPFGWGEICYRDFEVFIAGSVLVKPDVSHLSTFPALYEKDETYVAVAWDYSDLNEKLVLLKNDYEPYRDIAERAQAGFKAAYESYAIFKTHFDGIIGRLAGVEARPVAL